MRLPYLAGIVLLLPLGAQAEGAMCEYHHPDRPAWNYFTACDVEESISSGGVTLRANVVNGSRFTIEDAAGEEGLARVNGLAATRLGREDARCYRTEADGELLCVHPRDAARPATAASPPASVPGPAGTGFGGGQAGFCLLASIARGTETLVEYGPCIRRENCLASEAGGTTCLTDHDWTSGRLTEMARADDWQTLDGATVNPDDKGCFTDVEGGLRFCFSQKAMTAAEHPVLAATTP